MFLRSYSRIAIGLFSSFCLALTLASNASAKGKEQVLYSFQGIPDGSIPVGGVVLDASGNLYGATTTGVHLPAAESHNVERYISFSLPASRAADGRNPSCTYSRVRPTTMAKLLPVV